MRYLVFTILLILQGEPKTIADYFQLFPYKGVAEYMAIQPKKSYDCMDAFCDEQGMINNDFPRMNWNVQFSASAAGAKVEVEITFASEADLLKIAELGFEEGFTMAHGNLDRLLDK